MARTVPTPTASVPPPAPEPVPAPPASSRWRAAWHRMARALAAATPHDLLALGARFAMAGIFWQSGRTKVEGWLSVTPGAIALFRVEYQVPVLPPAWAAHLAAYAEHLFPVLLVIGLASRLSALALLGMTAVIQLFVYPQAWPTHLSWAVLLLYVAGQGAGRWSLDRALRIA